jgi:hypothetical protein
MFITALIRTVVGHDSGYTIVKTKNAKSHAAELHSSLASGKSVPEAFHNLLLAVFDSEGDENAKCMWDCPVTSWMAARALKEDGGFLAPHNFTVVLAKFKYIIRAFAVIEGHYMITADDVSPIAYVNSF